MIKSKRTVLVTGGSGFVGANLVRRLLADGHRIHATTRSRGVPWRLKSIADEISLHAVNLSDREGVYTLVRNSRPDWVFHLAVHGAYPEQNDLQTMVESNVLGTINLIDACVDMGFEALVNTGSSSEYGYKSHAPSESEVLEPNSPYAITKAAGTHYCQYVARQREVAIPTLRLYSAYGPYEEPSRLIPALVLNVLRGELPPLAAPNIARDYIHVDDVVRAFLAVANTIPPKYDTVYNVGTGLQTTLQQLVDLAVKLRPVSVVPIWGSIEPRKWDTDIWVCNNSRILSETDWTPEIPLGAGLLSTVAWFEENESIRRMYENARTMRP